MKTPHQLTENVKLLQKVVVWQGEKFLILQRSADSATRPKCWDLPGGNVEWPASSVDIQDSHLADLAREVKEETGLIIDIIESNDLQNLKNYPPRHHELDSGSQNADRDAGIDQDKRDIDMNHVRNSYRLSSCYVGSYFESKKQIYTIIIGWQYRLSASTELPKIELSDEHQNFAWIKPTDFDQYDFGFAGEKGGFIREIIRNAS